MAMCYVQPRPPPLQPYCCTHHKSHCHVAAMLQMLDTAMLDAVLTGAPQLEELTVNSILPDESRADAPCRWGHKPARALPALPTW